MRVDEIMSAPALVCHAQDTLNVAAHQMWDADCGAILVVNDEGVLVGIVTDRDICMAGLSQNLPLSEIPVHVAMARQVYAIERHHTIEHAERVMAAHQVRRLPIVDRSGAPLGMISINDLTRELARPQAQPRNGLARLVQTLALISEPRDTTRHAA